MSIFIRQTFATRWNKVIQLPAVTQQVRLIQVSKCFVKSQDDEGKVSSPAASNQKAEVSTSFAKKGSTYLAFYKHHNKFCALFCQ